MILLKRLQCYVTASVLVNEELSKVKAQFDEFKVESGIFAKKAQNVSAKPPFLLIITSLFLPESKF